MLRRGVQFGVGLRPCSTAPAQQPATQARVALSEGLDTDERRFRALSRRTDGMAGKEASIEERGSREPTGLRVGGVRVPRGTRPRPINLTRGSGGLPHGLHTRGPWCQWVNDRKGSRRRGEGRTGPGDRNPKTLKLKGQLGHCLLVRGGCAHTRTASPGLRVASPLLGPWCWKGVEQKVEEGRGKRGWQVQPQKEAQAGRHKAQLLTRFPGNGQDSLSPRS